MALPRILTPRRLALLPALIALAAIACGDAGPEDDPTATPPAGTATHTPTRTPTNTPTPTPTPTATPTPDPAALFTGLIVGSDVFAWSKPTTGSTPLHPLPAGTHVPVLREVQGEDWIVAGQTWQIEPQGWHAAWYEIAGGGGFVYTAWVYQPQEGESLPTDLPAGERRVDVDTTTQTLTFSIDGIPYHTARVSTGKPGYETPAGSWTVNARIEDEFMTSAGQGYPGSEQYDVENVLFTQYFTHEGHALHLNYWRPLSVFGTQATSHGCVGLLLHDAQWLWMAGSYGMHVDIHGENSTMAASEDDLRPGGP